MFIKRLLNAVSLGYEIFRLPKIKFSFEKELMSFPNVKETFFHFNKKHAKLKVFKNKQIGVAYIDLKGYLFKEDYLTQVNGKSSAYYYSRKCRARGYVLHEIDRNKYARDLALIESSMPVRQGRSMAPGYGEEGRIYEDYANYKYYGVMLSGKLVAYANVGVYGDFACVSRLMGHVCHLNDGVMYFLLTEVISNLIEEKNISYIIYDTWYGALPGLRQFKRKLGFRPCFARWEIKEMQNGD